MALPNILWFCTDQQRTDSLGCYGADYMHTPNIDRLSASGVTFENCYCQAPSCTPSRSSFLTGRYSSTVHCERNDEMKIPATEKLLPKLLADNGYMCGLSGKLHLAAVHQNFYPGGERRIDDGFHVFNWAHDPYDKWPTSQYQLWLADQGISMQKEQIPGIPGEVYFGMPSEYHHTKWCTDRAIDFIRTCHNHEKPFFFCCDVFDPHPPFDPPKDKYEAMLKRLDEIPDCKFTPGELDNKPAVQMKKHENKRYDFNAMDEEARKKTKAAYYAQVENVDEQVGRLIRELETLGELDNTLIIFCSDHGEMLGDHGIFNKGSFYYNELTRIPLILSWKGHLPEGMRYRGLGELVDLFPTICEMLSLDPGTRIQGTSMWSGLVRGEETPKEYALCQSIGNSEMLTSEDWKIVLFRDGTGELYDLKNDPDETWNRFDDPAYAQAKLSMMTALACKRLAIDEPPPPPGSPGY